jgi:hypothetical protein
MVETPMQQCSRLFVNVKAIVHEAVPLNSNPPRL